jgi:hypothetical protein
VDHAENAAHHPLGCERTGTCGRRRPFIASAFDYTCELIENLPTMSERRSVSAEGLHHAQSREPWLLVEEREDRVEPGSDRVDPSGARLVGPCHARLRLGYHLFDRCEQTIVAILEQDVERLSRHPGHRDELLDGCGLGAVVACDANHGGENPPPLRVPNVVTVASGGSWRSVRRRRATSSCLLKLASSHQSTSRLPTATYTAVHTSTHQSAASAQMRTGPIRVEQSVLPLRVTSPGVSPWRTSRLCVRVSVRVRWRSCGCLVWGFIGSGSFGRL